MQRKTLFYLLFALFVITSCANLPSQKIPKNFNQDDNEGLVIGAFSIKNEKPIFNGYGLHYTSTDFQEKLTVNNRVWIVPEQMISMKLKPDFFDGEKGVYYFAFKKPPGNYTFQLVSLFVNGGMFTENSSIPINFPFKVEKGKITYVGEIYLDYRQRSVVQNFTNERDFPKLKEKFPSIDWSNLSEK